MAGKNKRYINSNIHRSLLVRSGNKCAYPGCNNPIISKQHKLVGQLCHIESVSHENQRFNPILTEEQLNGFENLMFMCYEHHIETNDEAVYTVAVMKTMKYNHEQKYVLDPFHLDTSDVFRIKMDIENYWEKLEKALASNPLPELRVIINTRANYNELSDQILESIAGIENLVDLLPGNRDTWEITEIGFPNQLNKMKILLDHMKLKYLECYLQSNPGDMEAMETLKTLQNKFIRTSKDSITID